MNRLRLSAAFALAAFAFSGTVPSTFAFSDVRTGITPYSAAIERLRERGVLEGYEDGSFKPTANVNRAEFVKIILESRGGEFTGSSCFPDVGNEWYARYVCAAKGEGIIAGYPDGWFRPERPINFAEASKIMALAFGQEIETSSPDWYEPYARALEVSKAIPLSIEKLDQDMSRGEMAEMMWRLTEGLTDQPSKGYLNVKYPEVMVNMAADTPQKAGSCADLKAFTEEASRSYGYGYGYAEDALGMPMMMRSMNAETAGSTAPASGMMQKSYSETNVQVQGVDEADIVKTDGTYVYAVLEGKVRIIRAHPPEAMGLMSTIDLQSDSFSPTQMYVEGDRLILLGNSWQTFEGYGDAGVGVGAPRMASMIAPPFYGGNRTEVRVYDVSDRAKPSLSRTVSFDGSEVSSRKIGSKLYLVLNESVRWHVPGPVPMPLETDILPLYRDSAEGGGEQAVARCGDVVILPHIPQPQYLVVAVVPTDSITAEVKREVVLGSATNVYASLQNLYVAAVQWNYSWRGDGGSTEETSLYRFAFTDSGIELKAHGRVPGRILNQFSMDEHEGHLRIATTKGQAWDTQRPSMNNVYVLNMNLERTGQVEDIAPGETIYSARFMGDRGYVVTFKKVDPFFALDLSDPANPRILGALKIPGYSDYLHPYDDTHIIGFGKEAVVEKGGEFAWYQGMKIALFDVTDPTNPTQLHSFAIGDRGTESPLLHDHKALLFDKERNLLAFPVQVHTLSEDQKRGDPGSAWGEPSFQGAYVMDITLKDGFTLRGTITHYNDQDYLKAGGYFWGKNIERILRIEDSLLTLSAYGIQSHDERTVQQEASLGFEEADHVSACPEEGVPGVKYVSKNAEECTRIDFFCAEGQKAFSNECGCGCTAQ